MNFLKIAKGSKFAVESVSYGNFSLKCFYRRHYEVCLAKKNQETLNVEKKYDEEKVFFEEKTFSYLKIASLPDWESAKYAGGSQPSSLITSQTNIGKIGHFQQHYLNDSNKIRPPRPENCEKIAVTNVNCYKGTKLAKKISQKILISGKLLYFRMRQHWSWKAKRITLSVDTSISTTDIMRKSMFFILFWFEVFSKNFWFEVAFQWTNISYRQHLIRMPTLLLWKNTILIFLCVHTFATGQFSGPYVVKNQKKLMRKLVYNFGKLAAAIY